jgi:hypothetical protein
MISLVIRGAYYYNKDGDNILVPHYTGEYVTVDCDEFARKDEIKSRYDNQYIKNNKDNYIEYDDNKYYYAEYSPFNVGDWELLSDVSQLEHFEEDFDF